MIHLLLLAGLAHGAPREGGAGKVDAPTPIELNLAVATVRGDALALRLGGHLDAIDRIERALVNRGDANKHLRRRLNEERADQRDVLELIALRGSAPFTFAERFAAAAVLVEAIKRTGGRNTAAAEALIFAEVPRDVELAKQIGFLKFQLDALVMVRRHLKFLMILPAWHAFATRISILRQDHASAEVIQLSEGADRARRHFWRTRPLGLICAQLLAPKDKYSFSRGSSSYYPSAIR